MKLILLITYLLLIGCGVIMGAATERNKYSMSNQAKELNKKSVGIYFLLSIGVILFGLVII